LLGRTLRDESARPLRVSPLTAQLLTVGVDIGGTKVAAGVVTHEGEVLDQVRRETPDRSKSPQVVEDTIVDAVLDLAERHEIHAWASAPPASSTPSAPTCCSPRTCPGATNRCARRSAPGCGCRWWSRTTPTPPSGPSGASVPGAASRTWSA
jgi:hypothetical protein